MAIKDRIKEARLKNGYTQEQLAQIIGVAKSTLAGYELGSREPSIVTIIKIMQATGVDANYLWQDEMDFPIQVSYVEMEHINKYRNLDDHGREMVDFVLDAEYQRWKSEQENSSLIPMAARNDQEHEAGQQELMRQDLNEL